MINENKRTLISWCFYEWASSSFAIVITTFIFATYFTTHIAVNEITGTYQWANATAIAGIVIAILSPIFGAIADYSGRIKLWLFVFSYIAIISSALLWFAYPDPHFIHYTLACVIFGTIGFEVALVFYNSFLPHITSSKYVGRISGWAWGMGYLGGIVLLSITLFGFIKNPPAWLNVQAFETVRISGPLVALWYAIFSLPLFIFVPDIQRSRLNFSCAIKTGWNDLLNTLKNLPQHKNLFLYLIAHLVYIDGLNTLFAFGGIYAAGTFKMALSEVILFGLTMNIAAGIGAIALAWVDDYLGSKKTILLSLFFLLVWGTVILVVHHPYVFWGVALLLCLFVGPLQAASRSLMTRITPADKSTEMFGLYAFSGRITSFVGPWLLGLATFYSGSQRVGMATVLLFFLVGGALMILVREHESN